MGRFNKGTAWRFVVTDLDSAALTCLERVGASATVNIALNQPATGKLTVPSDDPSVNIVHTDGFPFVSFNDRLVFGLRREGGSTPWVCRTAGLLQQIEDAAPGDQPLSTLSWFDPWQYLFHRIVKNGTSTVRSGGLSYTGTEAGHIVEDLIENTIAVDGPCYAVMGTVETTVEIDINFQQGSTVGAALRQIVALGACDIEFAPIFDPVGRPGVCAVVNVYAQKGETRDSAVFAWGAGRQVSGISSLLDGDQMSNDVVYLGGQGGVDASSDPEVTFPSIDTDSQNRYGVWSEESFFPGQIVPEAVQAFQELVLSLKKQGRRTVTITPASLLAPVPLVDYTIGDRVPVFATRRLRQQIPWATDESVYQRVYGIPIEITDDGVETVRQLLASPDGFS